MGEVYQAHDGKLRREVALKLLSPALAASEEHLRRFEREARATSALNHPHICTIYDVGHAPEVGGQPYFVMELLRGQTLFDLLLSGPLPFARVVALGVQIADGLDAAHQAGIVHRDLKPANIFITARGDAKLLDFGLAAFTEASEPAAAGEAPRAAILTNPGTAVGTVLYMSPEQAMGDPLDRRTDLFSLGLVLYEMSTGRRPFGGRSTTAIVDAILHADVPGLAARDTSDVPKELRTLLARLLEKDKARRVGDASEVISFLRAVQSGSFAGREYAPATKPVSPSSSSGLSLGLDVFSVTPSFAPSEPEPQPPTPSVARFFTPERMAVGLALAAVAFGLLSWYRDRAPALVLREPVLLADFTNTTSEAVFDGALKDALEVQLQQSPFMNVVPASRMRAALQLMERPDDRVTLATAHDLCQRMGVKAILFGSIAPLGSAYLIGVEAQACKTGEVLAREQAQPAAKTDVLASMGAAAARLRERLGESIASIQRFNVPVQDATTPSLEALKAYSMGVETRTRTGDVQAIPFFEHALELDANFALASARLASIYTNLRDFAQARRYMERAFARSESLSEPERLFVKANHHNIVTGRLDEVVGTYRLWAQTYPQDWIPHNNLSAVLTRLGQLDEALEEAREAVRLGPDSVVPYQQLGLTLLRLDRVDECRTLLRDAIGRGLDSSYNRALLYDIAFLANDAGGMQEQLAAARSRPDSYLVVAEAARAAFATGDIDGGRKLYSQAVSGARAARIDDYAGSLIAEQAVWSALTGDAARGGSELEAALALSAGRETAWPASLAAAFLKRVPQATELAAGYERDSPPAADVVTALVPALKAAIALANNAGAQAVEGLNSATPHERVVGPWLPYLRGLAYESAGERPRAVSQFREVIGRRGPQATSLVHTLGQLQLARALTAAGDTAGAREAYEAFLAAWPNADSRHPLVLTARREAAALPGAASAGRQR